jgi:2-polyprenyl-6-hydroxyphenyl methylase/3-demethylubiquinone-9 3-methyltransferase
VNEHPIVEGRIGKVSGYLEHHDSPNLHHWIEKQNAYTTAEAYSTWREDALSAEPRLFGSTLQRRMWLKRTVPKLPFSYLFIQMYCLLVQGAWRAGSVGFLWARLRAEVYRLRAHKLFEMSLTGRGYAAPPGRTGMPDPRVSQFEDWTPAQRNEVDADTAYSRAAARRSIADHDHLAAGWEHRYTKGGFRRRAQFFERTILPRLMASGRWLDVGCGTGTFSRILARNGAEVLGVDGSSAMIGAAKRLAADRGTHPPQFKAMNIEALKARDASYDGLICLSVLEYLDTPEASFATLARIVRPGGGIVISVPNHGSPLRRAQELTRKIAVLLGAHAFDYLGTSQHRWSRKELTRLADANGLECQAVLGFDPILPRSVWRALPPSLLFMICRKPTTTGSP